MVYVEGGGWMWREDGGCGVRMDLGEGGGYGGSVDVEGGGCEEVERGCWMWREDGRRGGRVVECGCDGRVVDVEGGCWMLRESG